MIARVGIVLAVLQFGFALTWVVYATYLPALAAEVGIARSLVPWILLVDQAIFLVCDWLAGVFADRIDDAVARLGRSIALVTVGSCAAFLALPHVASGGSAPALVVLVVVWSASSSLLRAPTLVLVARHASQPQRAWLASVYALGLTAAGAAAPYVGRALVSVDPRFPFAATSCVVAVLTIVLVRLPRTRPAAGRRPEAAPPGSLAGFIAAIALLALGLQVHTSIAAAPLYLRFAARDDLGDLLPVFWIGAGVAALPAALLLRRSGGLWVMAGAGVLGVAALVIADLAGSLGTLIATQAVAGLAWGGMMSGAFAASTSLGRRAGSVTGLVFSMLAAATVARIALVASGLAAAPGLAPWVPLVPPIAWAAGTLVVGALVLRPGDGVTRPA